MPHRVWLGNMLDARNLRRIHEQGLQALVDLAATETPPLITRDLAYLRLPLIDAASNPRWLVRLAVDSVRELMRAQTPTLVYCAAGMSRSPAIVAAAIALETNRQLADCLREITSGYPHDVSAGLIADVLAAL